MPIPEYDRLRPPPEVDHSSFGEVILTSAMTEPSNKFPGQRTIWNLGKKQFSAPTLYNGQEFPCSLPSHLAKADVEFRGSYGIINNANVYLPYAAVTAPLDCSEILVAESLWHTTAYLSDYFRVDSTTKWQWRHMKPTSVDIDIYNPIAFTYHPYYFQYFHWFMDCLPRVWLLREHSPFRDLDQWLVGPIQRGSFQAESLKLLGLPMEKLVWIPNGVVRARQLVYSSFLFSESIKTRPAYNNGIHHKGWSPEYLSALRDIAFTRNKNVYPGPEKVYITRRDASHRKLRNESAVIDALERMGFVTICPGELNLEEQMHALSNAKIVVGLHGAGMTNLVWCNEGCRVIEIAPAHFDDPGYRFLSQIRGHDYSVLLAEQHEHVRGSAYADASVDIDLLMKVLSV